MRLKLPFMFMNPDEAFLEHLGVPFFYKREKCKAGERCPSSSSSSSTLLRMGSTTSWACWSFLWLWFIKVAIVYFDEETERWFISVNSYFWTQEKVNDPVFLGRILREWEIFINALELIMLSGTDLAGLSGYVEREITSVFFILLKSAIISNFSKLAANFSMRNTFF